MNENICSFKNYMEQDSSLITVMQVSELLLLL